MAGNISRRPEDELLLACARTQPDPERVRALARPELDWIYLIESAVRHRVTPLVHHHLQELCPESIPLAEGEFLRAWCRRCARIDLSLAAEVLGIIKQFQGKDILAIPYKGPVMACLAYGSPGFREFCDLDIIVRQRDVMSAAEVLLGRGYRVAGGEAALRGPVPGQYLFCRGETDPLTLVELHTEQTLRHFPRQLDLDRIAEDLTTVTIGGYSIPSFSPEDCLSFLCVHGAKDFWARLLWVADVAELARRPGLDWERAVVTAGRLGCSRMLYLGLCLAEQLLEAPVPEPVRSLIAEARGVESLAGEVAQGFFREPQSTLGPLERLLFRVRTAEDKWEAVRYAARLATAPTESDWEAVRLPGALSFLYPALRPFRLLGEYGWAKARRANLDLGPYIPSPPEAVEKILAMAELESTDVLYDLGCGDGRIVIAAAKHHGTRGVGVDIDPERIGQAKTTARQEGLERLVSFLCQDAKAIDLSQATVVTMYLHFVRSARLREKLLKELQPKARIISRDAALPRWQPQRIEKHVADGVNFVLYLYRMVAQKR